VSTTQYASLGLAVPVLPAIKVLVV